MKFSLTINGKDTTIDAHANIRLSVLLKDILQRKSIKGTCQCGQCGKCLVIIDGKPAYSCLIPASMVQNSSIVTLEYITQKSEYSNIIKGFELADVELCPTCAPSRILLTYNQLEKTRELSGEMIKNIIQSVNCDCTDNKNLKEALYLAANFYRGGN